MCHRANFIGLRSLSYSGRFLPLHFFFVSSSRLRDTSTFFKDSRISGNLFSEKKSWHKAGSNDSPLTRQRNITKRTFFHCTSRPRPFIYLFEAKNEDTAVQMVCKILQVKSLCEGQLLSIWVISQCFMRLPVTRKVLHYLSFWVDSFSPYFVLTDRWEKRKSWFETFLTMKIKLFHKRQKELFRCYLLSQLMKCNDMLALMFTLTYKHVKQNTPWLK